MSKLPEIIEKWKAWIALLVLALAAYAGIVAWAPNSPWPWRSEHVALAETHKTDTLILAGKIKSNTIRILEENVSYLQRERRALRAEGRALKRKGDNDPKIQEELDEIEDKLQEAKSKLKANRGH